MEIQKIQKVSERKEKMLLNVSPEKLNSKIRNQNEL